MTDLDTLPAQAVPARMNELRISADAFIEGWKAGSCEFLDIRTAAETGVWKMGFGLTIPADEIAARQACGRRLPQLRPVGHRAQLSGRRGFKAKYLMGGLLGLVDKLKGATSERIKLEQKE